MKFWKEGANQRSRIGSIIRETRELSSSFVDFSVTFTSRACNRVAHVLAKQVSGDNRLGEWQLAPTCVVHLLASDCNPDWSINKITKSQKKDISILWSAGHSWITPLVCLANTIALGAFHLSHHSRYKLPLISRVLHYILYSTII